MNRRTILKQTLLSSAAMMVGPSLSMTARADQQDRKNHKFQLDLCGDRVGIDANQETLIELAAKNGFTAVEPLGDELKLLSQDQLDALNEKLADQNLIWSAANLPLEFRKSETEFNDGLARLPELAQSLQRAKVTRIGTWIMPCHDSLTYLRNFKQHVARLSEAAKILQDHELRLGLEYVGTKTLWTMKKFPFVHTMSETNEMIAAMACKNVGLILDSWHWTMAGETADEIRGLINSQVVACDLNDAPAGVKLENQIDGVRELPMATGVIQTQAFLQALIDIEYDGPIRAEPFSRSLNELDNEAAAAATSRAMKKALATVGA